MRSSHRWFGVLFGATVCTVVIPQLALAEGESVATFTACVYEQDTGRPLEGARVFVQSLGSANGAGASTGSDGCVTGIHVNTTEFPGDYVEATYTLRDRTVRQQYRIPNQLIEQGYSYDFFLDLPER